MRSPMPRVSRRGRLFLVGAVTLAVLLLLAGGLVDILTDRLWFKEVHYTRVYSTMLWTRIGLFFVFGALMAGIVGGNLYLAYRLRPLLRPRSAEQHALDRYRMIFQPRIGLWIGVITGFIGLFAGLSGQGQWQRWLLFRNGGSFGVKDAQFGVDVGWYIFRFPFWRYLLGVGFTTIFLSLFAALAVHYLFGGIRLQGEGDRMTTAARVHLSTLVALFVGLKAVAYILDRRALVLSHNSNINLWGAGFTDVNALLPAKQILMWISVIVAVAILVFSNAWVRNLVWPGMALGLLVVAAIAVGGIYPWAVQTFQVNPNTRDKEATYIQRSVDATRQAFGLNIATTTPYSSANQTPPATLASDTDTVPNIRLLDPAVVADTFTQLQQVRGFYDFGKKLDIDRYTINGKTQDYVVGIRELDYNSGQGQAWNWQNTHTIYTHGYGFVAAPANKTVCLGVPYFVSGFLGAESQIEGASPNESCQSPADQIPAGESRIYYGEGMGSYAVVGRDTGESPVEFDRPGGGSGGDEYVTYNGTGGVSVGSYWRRLLYAYKYKEKNFLISSVFNHNSKVLYVRDPRERVEKIAPWLTVDGDPYPAVVNGRITWVLDGYTTASTYPYSTQVDLRSATSDAQVGEGVATQAEENINYLNNSVKATVDAYDGTVKLYAFGQDPIRDAWNKAFGGDVIQPESDTPPELAAHFRYPEDQFKVQRELLARFHVTDSAGFYSKQDFWQVPPDPTQSNADVKQPPYYLLTQMPGQASTTFQLVTAMTPVNRQNLQALISGSYVNGKPTLQILEVPNNQQQTVNGPQLAQQKMVAPADVKSQLTLFGSSAAFGNLLSLPIGGGMLYVEPLYIQSGASGQTGTNTYPQLKKILMAYGDYVSFADTVDEGIADLLNQAKTGQPTVTPPATNPGTTNNALSAAVGKINKALQDLQKAQTAGDFAAYGNALKELQAAVDEYNKAKGSAPAPTPTASPGG